MKLFIKTLVSACLILELYHEICAAVQTAILHKTSLNTPALLNRSVFTIVRFLNIPCSSPNGQISGVCFALNDCIRLQGTQIGTCASGFGVCCTFQRTCGTATSQNFTHFINPGFPEDITEVTETSCTLTLLRPHKIPVCQIRLDFLEFDLARPTDGDCLDDKFTVSGSNINAPVPELCGYNTGQHIYIDIDSSIGPVYLTVTTRGVGRRKWNIKVLFLECNNPSKAPSNCLQYHTGINGRFSSFNYIAEQASVETGGYLNNLNYAICFRKEVGRCSQTYTAESIESFQILNLNPNNSPTVGGGTAGLGINECPTDFLRLGGDRYCGARLNPSPSAVNPTTNAPVTDNTTGPIIAYFQSNSANNAAGYNIRYTQNACSG